MQPDIDQTFEIKARCNDLEAVRSRLLSWGAEHLGCETQVDIFYNVPSGRLKLRNSKSEKLLIGYQRPDQRGPKHCLVNLYAYKDADALDKALSCCLGKRITVKKERTRYLLGNVKFHLDKVEHLGTFLEIEVLGKRGIDSPEDLKAVCEDYMERCNLKAEELVEKAYADLLEELG